MQQRLYKTEEVSLISSVSEKGIKQEITQKDRKRASLEAINQLYGYNFSIVTEEAALVDQKGIVSFDGNGLWAPQVPRFLNCQKVPV